MNTSMQICQEIFDARHEEQNNSSSAYNPLYRSKNQTVSPFDVDVQSIESDKIEQIAEYMAGHLDGVSLLDEILAAALQSKAFNEQHPDLVDRFADFAVESEVEL